LPKVFWGSTKFSLTFFFLSYDKHWLAKCFIAAWGRGGQVPHTDCVTVLLTDCCFSVRSVSSGAVFESQCVTP
jgi:hypothetical protein